MKVFVLEVYDGWDYTLDSVHSTLESAMELAEEYELEEGDYFIEEVPFYKD